MYQLETNFTPLTILDVPSYEVKQHQKVQKWKINLYLENINTDMNVSYAFPECFCFY